MIRYVNQSSLSQIFVMIIQCTGVISVDTVFELCVVSRYEYCEDSHRATHSQDWCDYGPSLMCLARRGQSQDVRVLFVQILASGESTTTSLHFPILVMSQHDMCWSMCSRYLWESLPFIARIINWILKILPYVCPSLNILNQYEDERRDIHIR